MSSQVLSKGRLATFTSSNADFQGVAYKKKPATQTTPSGVTRWKPTVFDFKSGTSTPCPTCQGTGRIPKGQEDELVALIPYNDKRLKPRRTCLYMSILIGFLLVTGGLLTAFLYPRNVDISIVSINSSGDYIAISDLTDLGDSDHAYLEIETSVEVKNSNFFPVWVSSMSVTLTNYQSQIGEIATQPFSVESRSTQQVKVVQNATFSDGPARRAKIICTSKNWQHYYIYIEAMVVLSYTYLSHGSNSIANEVNNVYCQHLSVPMETVTTQPHHHTTLTTESHSNISSWL